MKNKTRKAKVNANGSEIEVYKLGSRSKTPGKWCNAKNATDRYTESELTFLN
jgi:hypothetical protein